MLETHGEIDETPLKYIFVLPPTVADHVRYKDEI